MTDNSMLEYLKTCETKIIRLDNDEPFAIIVKSDDIDSDVLRKLANGFKEAFGPSERRVPIFGIGKDEDVDFITLKEVLEKTNGIP